MSFHSGENMRDRALSGSGASLPPAPVADTPMSAAVPTAMPAAPDAAGQAFLGASARVAEAEFQAEGARSQLATAEGKQAAINDRIAVLDGERSEIINRRAAGRHEVDDGARLSLLDADLAALHKLQSDAAAATAMALSEVNNADRAVVHARQHLDLAEAGRQHSVLSEHATMVADLLCRP